uniref:AlNc14C24G2414 protein n=1 Tax=Albugo laibachii Nc14 TaxID=890382 RepID=F0W6B5_9STRA|nr:AlNc14C24G2414 [Albugo laibachii Nc14]|eukprot:CCA16658.1 AlNc14C24G2414 [Albugo laibachii Nc14]
MHIRKEASKLESLLKPLTSVHVPDGGLAMIYPRRRPLKEVTIVRTRHVIKEMYTKTLSITPSDQQIVVTWPNGPNITYVPVIMD